MKIGRRAPRDPRSWTMPSGKPRGWSVTSVSSSARDPGRSDPRLRNLWASGRSRFYRLLLLAALVWVGYDMIFSAHGWLHLRALGLEEQDLREQSASVRADLQQVHRDMNEDRATATERALREKYRKSRKGEIIYQVRTVELPPDSGAASPAAGAVPAYGQGREDSRLDPDSGAGVDETGAGASNTSIDTRESRR
jgi:cell division protein FtsB